MLSNTLLSTVGVITVAIGSARALIAEGFTHDQITGMRQLLKDRSHQSWEYGAAVEALLELDWPDLSVYGPNPFPPPYTLSAGDYPITIASMLVDNKPAYTAALMDDGAAGDPASNGIAVLLGNYTYPDDPRYYNAFKSQIDFIQYGVPQTGDGAISHRVSEVQLWADNVYMVPPVLAYWGAVQTDLDTQREYLTLAYNQIRLYRDYLRDPDAGNVWHHIVLGSWSDTGHWATGQGWAAGGILRVHQTIAKSALRDEMSWALTDLANWAEEIVAGTWAYQKEDGSLFNYLDRDDSFMELSATSFMAAVTYRLAIITDVTSHIHCADKAFALVKNNIAGDGRLMNVVNPYDFTTQYSDVSPEGQAMALMLQAAFRDYQAFSNNINDSLGGVFGAFGKIIEAAQAKATSTEEST
jgi:hypothetical protein